MLCNAISDERGLPRVISCAARNVAAYAAINPWRCEQLFFTAYHAQHGFREASKTRSASIYDGERTKTYATPRKAERDTVLRSLYEPERSFYFMPNNFPKRDVCA